jgi:uncharacterized protein (DUF885 family)
MRLMLIPLLLAFASGARADADADFKALYQREWQHRLDDSPQLATSVGVHDHDAELGHVHEASQQARLVYYRGLAKELAAIDARALSAPERVNYAIFGDQLESAIGNIELKSYLMPMTSDSSFYADLAFLPRSHPFATAQDYRNYIKRLTQVPAYFDEHVVLLKQGLALGITLPQVVLKGRDAAIRAQAEPKSPEESVYYAPFKQMPVAIDPKDAEELRAAGLKAVRDSVIPAYAKLLVFMRDTYIPGARKTLAAEALPNGKAFYRRQIKDYVTLDLEPAAIHEKGLAEVARIHAEMETVMKQAKFEGDFAAFLKFLRTDPQFYAKDADELLMRAAWVAKRVDGQLPRFFGTLPRLPFGIQPVPEAIAPYYTGGRYVPPSYGSTEPGYYWVNTYDLKSRPLYVLPALTLHESVPGHHLQGALANEQGEQPPFRRFSYISAFGEGWALYTEHLGDEMGIYRTPYEQFGRLTYEMWRACRLVVDTGIHSKNWTREQALAFLHDNTALSEHEIETETDRYISWPGQALSYKLGELKIRELRARAEKELGPKFDLRAFHDAILALGSVPLPVLEQQIDAFIAKRKG